jgi:hypothetical protein
LEYLYEEIEGREDDAPFHILLLPSWVARLTGLCKLLPECI